MSRHIVDLPEDWKNLLINKYNNDFDILFVARDGFTETHFVTNFTYIIIKKDNKYSVIQRNSHYTGLDTLQNPVYLKDGNEEIIKYNKKEIIKFMEFMFKRDVYCTVNGMMFKSCPPDTKTIKHKMLCSIFDYEFYKLLSKKFNVYRFDDPEAPGWCNGTGVPCHHVLSKRIKFKDYQESQNANATRWRVLDPSSRVEANLDSIWKSLESPEIRHSLVENPW